MLQKRNVDGTIDRQLYNPQNLAHNLRVSTNTCVRPEDRARLLLPQAVPHRARDESRRHATPRPCPCDLMC